MRRHLLIGTILLAAGVIGFFASRLPAQSIYMAICSYPATTNCPKDYDCPDTNLCHLWGDGGYYFCVGTVQPNWCILPQYPSIACSGRNLFTGESCTCTPTNDCPY
jgi:hypothetical protein